MDGGWIRYGWHRTAIQKTHYKNSWADEEKGRAGETSPAIDMTNFAWTEHVPLVIQDKTVQIGKLFAVSVANGGSLLHIRERHHAAICGHSPKSTWKSSSLLASCKNENEKYPCWCEKCIRRFPNLLAEMVRNKSADNL